MKTKNLFNLIWLFIAAMTFNACVEDTDYETPPVAGVEPNVTVTKTIGDVLGMYKQGETVQFENNDVVEGYVVSSDEAGNFYQKLIIQDKPENPTSAIEIRVSGSNLYTKYEVGRKVYVKLQGLGLNDYKGTKQIGVVEGSKLGLISNYESKILRSTKLEKIVPKVVTVADVKGGKVPVGILIKLENMYSQDAGKTYAIEKKNTNRTFNGCKEGKIILRTSGYAKFYNQKIPEKSGSLVAILGVYNTTYQLSIRDTSDVNFDKESCQNSGGGTTTGVVVSELNETFDAVTPKKDFSLDGWLNIAKGTRKWSGAEFNKNKYAQISGYKAKESEVESWLITPGLDLSKATNKNFTFDAKRGYSKGETLEVLISSDFKGDVNTATWKKLDVTLPESVSNGYGKSFLNSGDIDLSAFEGVVYIAFKYIGNNSDKTGTYQIDNVKFNYTPSNTGGGTTAEKTVSDLRGLFTGSKVTITEDAKIKAVVTSDATTKNISGRNAFVQDGTAGIALRFDADHSLKLGEEVEISIKDATLSEYGGLLQLNIKSANVLTQKSGTLPTPKIITVADALTGNYESQLVKIEGVQFKDITKKYAKANTLTSDCTDALATYINDKATFANDQVSTKKGTITGVMTEFRNKAQIYLRGISDISFTEDYACGSTGGGTTAEKTVSDLRKLFTGSTTTVTEDAKIKVIVTSDATAKNISGRNAFVQDATAGIALRFDANHSLKLGEEVEVSIKDATLSEYKGLLQLNVTASNILSQVSGTLPQPKVITIAQALTGDYESQLVKIEGVQFKDITKTYSGANELTSDCSDALTVYVSGGATFKDTQVSDKKGSITGVMSERDNPQLYIRDANDVNFTEAYACGSTGGSGSTGGGTTGGTSEKDLFFSEYVEGSSNNKYIEIYNGTGADVDLSKYQVWGSNNGSGWKATRQLQLTGTLAAGEFYIISTDRASAAILAKANLKLPYESPVHYNGDDAVGLAKDNGSGTYELIDVVGDPNNDPGSGWTVSGTANATKDHTLIRKSSVSKGNTDWSASSGAEWEVKAKDDFSSLGVR